MILTKSSFPVEWIASSSGCIEHRARELRLNSPLTLIPECDTEGNYKARQCHPPSTNGKRFCQCWAPDGAVITSPSQKTEQCECHRQRFQSTGRNAPQGAFTPECQENGKFKEKQCNGSTGSCWCVDPVSGVQRQSQTSSGGAATDLNCVTRTLIGRRGWTAVRKPGMQ